MTVPGLGGQQSPAINAPGGPSPAPGVTPGVSRAIVIANSVVVFGPSGSPVGLFVYAAGTTPAAGNPPLFWATNQSADPYGNAVTPEAGVAGAGQFTAGNTIINGSGIFTYSAAPAAGNLIATQAPANGTDGFGNNYLAGITNYGTGVATQISSGFMNFYKGSLGAGWTLESQILVDSVGDLSITAGASLSLFANSGTADLSASGGATLNGSANTGDAATDAAISTTSGNFNGGTLTSHNHSHGHTHPL